MDYRSLPRYANSDLTEFRNLLSGHRNPLTAGAVEFGASFRQLLFEQELPPDLTPARLKQAERMRETLQKDDFCQPRFTGSPEGSRAALEGCTNRFTL